MKWAGLGGGSSDYCVSSRWEWLRFPERGVESPELGAAGTRGAWYEIARAQVSV